MVSIILFILKILLIIIGVILGIAIFLLALVLFVPIIYEATGSKDETLYLEGKASWLFQLIRLKFYYHDSIHYEAKIFWKKVYTSEPSQDGNNTEEIKRVSETKVQENKVEVSNQKKVHIAGQVTENQVKENQSTNQQSTSGLTQQTKSQTTSKNIRIEGLPSGTKKESHKTKKVKKIKINKKEKVKKEESGFKNFFETVRSFFAEEAYKGVIKFVVKHSLKMIKSIIPRKIRLHLEFGTNDPAMTGYILGLLSIFYAFTGNSMDIKPDFEKQLFKGDFSIKGKIFIFVLVYHGLRIILDKRVKKLIAEYNH